MGEDIEHVDDSTAAASGSFGRREMLQRTGFVVGAAALWNTPIIKTVGMSAAAATPPPLVAGFSHIPLRLARLTGPNYPSSLDATQRIGIKIDDKGPGGSLQWLNDGNSNICDLVSQGLPSYGGTFIAEDPPVLTVDGFIILNVKPGVDYRFVANGSLSFGGENRWNGIARGLGQGGCIYGPDDVFTIEDDGRRLRIRVT